MAKHPTGVSPLLMFFFPDVRPPFGVRPLVGNRPRFKIHHV